MRLAYVLIAGVVGLGASTGVAQAQKVSAEDKQRAADLFEQGLRQYNLGEYDRAIELWKQGYEISGEPTFLYNLGQAYRMKGDHAQALKLYRAYLRDKPDAANRAQVEERIAEMEQAVAEQKAPPREPEKPTAPADRAAPPEPEARQVSMAPGDDGFIDGGGDGGDDTAVTASASTAPPSHVALLVRGDMDTAQFSGGLLGFGAIYVLDPRVELGASLMVGPRIGASVTGTYVLTDGEWRPIVSAGFPVFFEEGTIYGAQLGVGLRWFAFEFLAVQADVTGAYFFNPPEVVGRRYIDGYIVPSLGVQVWL